MPQLISTTFHMLAFSNRRWPYQAMVMNTLEISSSSAAVIERLSVVPSAVLHLLPGGYIGFGVCWKGD